MKMARTTLFLFAILLLFLSCSARRRGVQKNQVERSLDLIYLEKNSGEFATARLEICKGVKTLFRLRSSQLKGLFPFDTRFIFQDNTSSVYCWGGGLNNGNILHRGGAKADSSEAISAHEIEKTVYGRCDGRLEKYWVKLFVYPGNALKYYLEYVPGIGFVVVEDLVAKVRYELVAVNERKVGRIRAWK